jgi:hypothetical protein
VQAGIAVPLWFLPHTAKIKAAKIAESIARAQAEYYTKSLSENYQTLFDEN